MKMSQFNYFFFVKYMCKLKRSNIEGNAGRSASDLISVDAKYYSGEFYFIYFIYFIRSISQL